jgi:cell division protein FtsI (penicillin-binding protein 3)
MRDELKQVQIPFDFAPRARSVVRHRCLTVEQKKVRLALISIFSFCWVVLLVARLYSLQIADFETWQDWALKQHFSQVKLSSERGPILDRHGRLLAVSVPAGSIYVRPRQVKDPQIAAAQLAEILEIRPSEIVTKLVEKKPFVWIQRQVPRAVAERVSDLKLPGIGWVLESKRLYPFSEAGSALIGKAGIDGNGLSGIELQFDEKLRGESYEATVRRDALGNVIDVSSEGEFELPKGQPVKLTIDAAIQAIMEDETEAGRRAANAKRAMAIMIDSDTGEIVGMSQAPSFNFNSNLRSPKKLGNMAVETVFEPGSIMKPLVVASALDRGLIKPQDIIDCEEGRFLIGGRTIKDVHPSGLISVQDIVIRSSNIGMTKIGMMMGKEGLYKALRSYGFGEVPHLGLPGETPGLLRRPDRWAVVDIATHSFGQGVAVTPLQIVRATAVVANGGKLPELSVVDSDEGFESRRILSEKVATQVREMMYGVVEDERGTGHNAEISGVRIGGKTGTAQKARDGGRGYEPGKYIAGFVGFADAAPLGVQKNLTMMVVIDEPNTTSIYGGTLAAPVFRRIMQRTLHHLSTTAHLGGTNRQKDSGPGLTQRISHQPA